MIHADVFVYRVELPAGVNEMITPCEDGYTLYIDSRLSDEEALEKYRHAVEEHVAGRDFEKYDVQQIEHEAHTHIKGGM